MNSFILANKESISKKIACETCGKNFLNKSNFTRHKIIYTGVLFVTNVFLYNHVNRHLGLKVSLPKQNFLPLKQYLFFMSILNIY